MKFQFLIWLGIVLFSSCTIVHQGMITAPHPISNSNVTYVDEAVGYSKIHYFIGFGGYRTVSQVQEAKQKLFLNYPLSQGESFENLTLTERKTFFPFITRTEVFVFADVVRRDTNYAIVFNDTYLEKLKPRIQDSANFFKINQDVLLLGITNKVLNATIVDYTIDNMITLLVQHPNKIKVRTVTQDKLFSKSHRFGVFTIGSEVSFLSEHNKIDSGTLIGLNTEFGLVQTEKRAVRVEITKLIEKSPKSFE